MNEIAGGIKEFEKVKSSGEISPPQEAAESIVGTAVAAGSEFVERIGRRRWIICALLFFAATVNYVDRQVIGILKPTLQAEFGWTEVDYGWIVFSFQTAYAIGLFFVGRLMDRVGTRIGFAISIVVWSLAALGHAFAVGIGAVAFGVVAWVMTSFGFDPIASLASASVLGFIVVRFLLGLGESGNFPGVN